MADRIGDLLVTTPAGVLVYQRSSNLGVRQRRRLGWTRCRLGDLGQCGVRRIESVHKLLTHQGTSHVGAGIAAAVLDIVGNQLVARYKLRVGRRIQSATLVSDAKHSWLDALSSAGALVGLIAVALGQPWGDPVAGLAVTLFICHVGYEVTTEVSHRLLDGVDDGVLIAAEHAAASVEGIAHARARWTGRTLRIDIEGWVEPTLSIHAVDTLGCPVGDAIHTAVPEARAVTFTPRAMPQHRLRADVGPQYR